MRNLLFWLIVLSGCSCTIDAGVETIPKKYRIETSLYGEKHTWITSKRPRVCSSSWIFQDVHGEDVFVPMDGTIITTVKQGEENTGPD